MVRSTGRPTVLKRRIIPIQLLDQGRLVKTREFAAPRDVGDPIASSKVYSAQHADELIFLNVSRDRRDVEPMLGVLEKVSEVVFMPLALGGGIRDLEGAAALLRHGADKVVVDSAVYERPSLVTEIAERFGSQAVIVALDVRRDPSSGEPTLFSDCGRRREAVAFEEHVRRVVEAGAGELLVQSIDRDGTMSGYDVELVGRAARIAPVPVIACGGAGNYEHMREVFAETEASAVACGSLFNFGDNNPMRAKAHLSNHGFAFKVV